MMMDSKKENTAKHSRLATGLLLIVVILFLFNFNFEAFKAGAAVGPVTGEGTPGFIAKWVTPSATTGTLTPALSSCTVASGQSSCTQTLTPTIINPIGASTITSPTGTPSPVTVTSGTPQSFTVPGGGGVIFNLINNGATLATATVTPNCAGTTVWNGSVCAPSSGSVTLTPDPNPPIIVAGGSVILTWSCPVGTTSVGSPNPPFNTGGASSGSISVSPTSTTTYTVTCDGTSASVTVIVKKKPIFIED